MANSGANGDTGDDNGVRPEHESDAGTPRWVKVFAIIALVLILLFVALLLTGVGDHGPGRHASGGLASPVVTDDGGQRP